MKKQKKASDIISRHKKTSEVYSQQNNLPYSDYIRKASGNINKIFYSINDVGALMFN